MGGPSSIMPSVEGCGPCQGVTGNDLPILNEIRHALKKLLDTGEGTAIDLRRIPMAPGEEGRLENVLGLGEVTAQLNALGPSEIRETAFPGVWLVTHHNTSGETISKFIEVTWFPSILKAQQEDVKHGLKNLTQRLSELAHSE